MKKIFAKEKIDLKRAWQQFDNSDFMKVFYLKIESEYTTTGRLKWVRQDFVQSILDAGQHHLQQPFIPNQLAKKAELYTPQITINWNDGIIFGGDL